MEGSTADTCLTSTRPGSPVDTAGRLQRLLCVEPQRDCADCNGRIVCEAELAGVCVPVYAAAKEMGILLRRWE